jgi:hypothetical protein
MFIFGYAFFGLFMTCVACAIDLPRLTKLAGQGIATKGIVTGTACQNHGSVSYTFDVDGGAYKSGGSGVDCARLRAGDKLDVWYVRDNPSLNSPTDAKAELKSRGDALIVVPLIFGALGFLLSLRVAGRKG